MESSEPAKVALVALGGALGSVMRYAAGALALARLGPAFPWGTLAINALGSALLGAFAAYSQARAGTAPLDTRLWPFFATGVCGGFTTFSTFALETTRLSADGRPGAAVGYVVASVLLSLGGAALGAALGRRG